MAPLPGAMLEQPWGSQEEGQGWQSRADWRRSASLPKPSPAGMEQDNRPFLRPTWMETAVW